MSSLHTSAQSSLRQTLFSGTYKNRLDAKGRVSLPAEFRQTLYEGLNENLSEGLGDSLAKGSLVKAKPANKGETKGNGAGNEAGNGSAGEGGENAIYAFPSPRGGRLEALSPTHFRQICREIESSAAMFSDQEDNLMAQIVSAARRISLDGNGRILLPKDFLDAIGIANTAVFVGFARRFVIFSESSHQRWYKERSRRSIAPLPIPLPTTPSTSPSTSLPRSR